MTCVTKRGVSELKLSKAQSPNMGDKVTPSSTPKDASHPSHHPDIKLNKSEGLKVWSNKYSN